MTEEKSYCFYDTRFARFTAGACFYIALLQFAGWAPVWLLELNCWLGIKTSVCGNDHSFSTRKTILPQWMHVKPCVREIYLASSVKSFDLIEGRKFVYTTIQSTSPIRSRCVCMLQ